MSAEDERLKQLLRENTHIWGSVLVGVGAQPAITVIVPIISVGWKLQ